ncbi:MAG: helix-turn-helix transcriptional regulator, partial [Treponema sp.]|nr:helix-turn-helix transcriptional regulator [Treponema sp.]
MSSVFDDFRMNLKFYREKKGFSQSDLAVQANCSNALIGNIEAGRVKHQVANHIEYPRTTILIVG